MTITVVAGGRIIDQRGQRPGDVVVDDATGLVVEVAAPGTAANGPGTSVLDAVGCLVCPGFVDLNAHLRQPGNEGAETVETAARAAALGGYTAIVAMPDTDPCTDNAAVVSEILALAKSAACDVVPAAALSANRDGTALAPLGELLDAGVRLFSDADRSIQDPALLRRAMEYLGGVAESAAVTAVVADRPEIRGLAAGGVMHEGDVSARLGLPGRPAVAEELAVVRDLALARLTGTPLHLQQITTATAVALVRAAKAEGQAVTAEVSPHHLVLDESACAAYDPNVKTRPPLRTEADVVALRAGLLEGTIDAVATDHSPWAVDTKEQPFDQAPFGVIGLETAVAVLLTELDATLEQLLPALSWQPAAIASLEDRQGGPIEVGRPASLTVFDPDLAWTVEPGRMASRSVNTPFAGRTLTGRARHTIVGGRPTVIAGHIATEEGTG
ncbi:MAG: dihydroorotase [Acidimicrobiia bacterium]|nr:dihydroorotase [Acidimicrobiia bacterium]